MFGKRFEYKDPLFQAMVERDHETIRLTGSASILVPVNTSTTIILKRSSILSL